MYILTSASERLRLMFSMQAAPLKSESHLSPHRQNRLYFYREGLTYNLEHDVKTKTDCVECVLEAGFILYKDLLMVC